MKYLTWLISWFNEWLNKPTPTLDLTEKSVLKFTKNHTGYTISFYNPLFKEFWDLPNMNASIFDRWSFQKKGSYGPYSHHKMTCFYRDVDSYMKQYKNLGDIQKLFDSMNKEYNSFEENKKVFDSLPNVLINKNFLIE